MIYKGEILNGTYQVIRQIGEGGTGLVFLAFHRNLRKYVVVKRVESGIANIETLRAETDILKNLHNSHIPQVYDFLVRDGEVFTVMDFIEGISFDKLPAENRHLSETFLLNLLLQMGQTLSYLHRHNPPVIHSDIKPDNLILKADGEICLIDFNISVSTSVTSSLSGYSIHFVSPEQWRRSMDLRAGKWPSLKLDARTDIYSTGAMFYYLVTGLYPDTRLPKGASVAGSYRNVTGSASRSFGSGGPNTNGADVLYRDMAARGYSDAFCRVIAKCLELDRRNRFADGSKLYNAVRHIRRMDSRFQKYLFLRAGSWILTAMLIGSGSWFLLKGVHQSTVDAYTQEMESFTSDLSLQNIQQASLKGARILNNSRYEVVLKEKPQDAALILQALGDAAYAMEQYGEAQSHYEEALSQAKKWAKSDHVSISRFYRDYAVSLAMDGQLRRAQVVLDEAEYAGSYDGDASGITDPDSALVEAYINLQNRDYETCIETVTRILNMDADGDLKARACTIAADSSKMKNDEEQETAWLTKAVQYSGEAKYQRLLAACYWEKAGDTRRMTDEQRSYAQLALQCYERLALRPNPLMDDVISYVIVMQYLGQYKESLRFLEPIFETEPSEYRIPMYMAFAYDALLERAKASSYADKALEIYESLPYDKQQGMEREDIKLLKEIR